jgi:hypothetical protein
MRRLQAGAARTLRLDPADRIFLPTVLWEQRLAVEHYCSIRCEYPRRADDLDSFAHRHHDKFKNYTDFPWEGDLSAIRQ